MAAKECPNLVMFLSKPSEMQQFLLEHFIKPERDPALDLSKSECISSHLSYPVGTMRADSDGVVLASEHHVAIRLYCITRRWICALPLSLL